MAIAKKVTFEGTNYNLDSVHRVAAHAAADQELTRFHKITGHALVDSDDSVVTWTQPANTIITNIWLVCTTAPTVASGDIGYEVGTSSSGAQIVATSTDTVLDGGTTVTAGYGKKLTLATSDIAAGTMGGIDVAERSIYFNLIATTDASVQGEFMWIVELLNVDATTIPSTGTTTAA